MVTANDFRAWLDYEPTTGIFRWRRAPARWINPGRPAGCLANGYILIKFEQRLYFAHRLAWLFSYGKWPIAQIDHINGVRDDNRIANLREVSSSENHQNRISPQPINSTMQLGVRQHHTGKFQATIKIRGKTLNLGLFNTIDQASQAYWQAKAIYHPASVRRPAVIIADEEEL